jgi:hypothetical protein
LTPALFSNISRGLTNLNFIYFPNNNADKNEINANHIKEEIIEKI